MDPLSTDLASISYVAWTLQKMSHIRSSKSSVIFGGSNSDDARTFLKSASNIVCWLLYMKLGHTSTCRDLMLSVNASKTVLDSSKID